MSPRRLPSGSLPLGVTLFRSVLGGYTVGYDGKFIGWIHENGDRWNAYIRAEKRGESGRPLGRFDHDEAVRQIVIASGVIEQNGRTES